MLRTTKAAANRKGEVQSMNGGGASFGERAGRGDLHIVASKPRGGDGGRVGVGVGHGDTKSISWCEKLKL